MWSVLYYILYSVCFFISLLPFRVLYFLSDLLYFPLYYCIRYRRKIVRKNLTESFPDKVEKEIIGIEKKFYAFFCDYIFETLKLLSISKASLGKRMKFKNVEELDEYVCQGRSCGMYLGHYCNWEWITSLPMHTHEQVVCGQIYHILENKAFERLCLRLRERYGAICIPMGETLRKVIAFRNESKPFIIGFISDQVPLWNSIHYWTNFLNHDTPVFTGTERIAKQTNLVVYYADITRPKRGYYVCEFRRLTDSPTDFPGYEITEMYMRELEKTIIKAPQYWLWTHNRWKRTRENMGNRKI
ncbi:Lipid A biosynthesis lauroyltransferase [termite gut metagenome]|uniref:Lipid A biosynthesis lauroyltransferase n=1 Tax=termite gut metagenome TaxID=433724 RepID=A0A5J4S494_9ZZZZ